MDQAMRRRVFSGGTGPPGEVFAMEAKVLVQGRARVRENNFGKRF
ncbi:MAG: hypothetical protein ACLFOY_00595 [Desulfatibacillaceae bacterium]